MTAHLRPLSPAQVARIGADPAYLKSLTASTAGTLAFPRAWHALHFLLCRDPWAGPEPLNHAILGGAELGDDLGHGAARVLGPDLVRRVAQALLPIVPADLVAQNFNAAMLEAADIFPGGWEHSAGWPALLVADLHRLQDFYQHHADAGDAILITIA